MVSSQLCRRHPSGIGLAEYQQIITSNPESRWWGWRTMRRNMQVYARGTVRHDDHKTIVLEGWHAVLMNTEVQAKAMRNVVFLMIGHR